MIQNYELRHSEAMRSGPPQKWAAAAARGPRAALSRPLALTLRRRSR